MYRDSGIFLFIEMKFAKTVSRPEYQVKNIGETFPLGKYSKIQNKKYSYIDEKIDDFLWCTQYSFTAQVLLPSLSNQNCSFEDYKKKNFYYEFTLFYYKTRYIFAQQGYSMKYVERFNCVD